MQYADIAAAVAGGLLLAWIADLLTGRRGFGGTSLVSGIGLACGWFLAVRVFAVTRFVRGWRRRRRTRFSGSG